MILCFFKIQQRDSVSHKIYQPNKASNMESVSDSSSSSSSCTISSCMKALVEKEERECYLAVCSGAELEECYQKFIQRPPASVSIRSRSHAVQFLMTVADRCGEDREVVSVAMNYLDRFVALRMEADADGGSGARPGSTTRPATIRNDERDIHMACPRDNSCLEVYLLVAFDLAIRLHSPFSGDGFRAAVHNVTESISSSSSTSTSTSSSSSSLFAQSQTARTVSLDMDACSTATDSKSKSSSTVTPEERETDSESFTEKVKRKYQSGEIYISDKFTTLRQLSRNFSAQDFAQAQTILIGKLDFYLHPVIPTTIMRYMLKSLEYDLHLLSMNANANSTNPDDLELETRIIGFASYQIELSVFAAQMVNSKPSTIAYAALYNAMTQFLPPNSCSFLCQKLYNICRLSLGLEVDSRNTKQIRSYLLQLWEECHPSSVTQNDYEQEEEARDLPIEADASDDAICASDPDPATSSQDFDTADATMVSCDSFSSSGSDEDDDDESVSYSDSGVGNNVDVDVDVSRNKRSWGMVQVSPCRSL